MIPVYSFADSLHSCVTRIRYSPVSEDVIALGVDSDGYVRFMDLSAQKGANYDYYGNLELGNDIYTPHLCDFSFSRCGKCIYVGSSDGCVSLCAVNMLGNHLNNRGNQILALNDAHIGGAYCVYPSPNYDFIIFTGGGDGFIKQWDLRLLSNKNTYNLDSANNGNGSNTWSGPLISLWAHVTAVSCLRFNLEKHIMSCGINENIRIWNYDNMCAVETIDSGCDDLGVWDMVTSEDKVVVIGKSGDAWTFSLDYYNNSDCRDIKRISLKQGACAKETLFHNWRRICTFENNVVIPTLDNEDGVKAFIIDVNSCRTVDSLMYNDRNYPHNIASVDVHPNPNVGLVITGG